MDNRKVFSVICRITMIADNRNDFRNTVEKVFFADFKREQKKRNLNGNIETGIIFEEPGIKEL